MQSTALALSPSTQFLRPPCRSLNLKPSQLSPSTSLAQLDNISSVHKLSRNTSCHTLYSLYSNAKIPACFLISNQRYDSFKVRAAQPAAPGPESAGEVSESSGLDRTLQLGAMFGIWYLLNIYFNIYNKQVRYLYLYTSDPSF